MRAFLLILFGSAILSCERNEFLVTDCCPSCVDPLIKKSAPLEIWRYNYNGQTVYGTVADCCDQYNELYDSNCNYLCAPSGGFSGKGDGKCPDFADKAKDGVLVWKKN